MRLPRAPPTSLAGFGFRGDIALKFQVQLADEKRPPEFSLEQVLTVAKENEPTLPILVGYLHSFAYLSDAVRGLDGSILSPTGTYFVFCNNIDLLAKYRVVMNGIPFFVLPLDESTVWKEMMDLMGHRQERREEAQCRRQARMLMDAAIGFDDGYEDITFEKGLEVMESGEEPQRKPPGLIDPDSFDSLKTKRERPFRAVETGGSLRFKCLFQAPFPLSFFV